jgi:signal transduction histidine kinase
MAVGMAHIIRNPLASIRSSAELALEAPSPDVDHDTPRDIIAEVDRLEQTMRELILLARHERDGDDRVHVADLVRISVTRLEDVIARRGVTVSLDIQEPLVPVVGDLPGLQTALHNVLSGVLHAMKAGGPLVISLAQTKGDDAIEMTIANGEDGIPEDLIEQVLGTGRATTKRGFDPGLSLVGRVIERHGGRIALSSREGRAAISIHLPTGAQ